MLAFHSCLVIKKLLYNKHITSTSILLYILVAQFRLIELLLNFKTQQLGFKVNYCCFLGFFLPLVNFWWILLLFQKGHICKVIKCDNNYMYMYPAFFL